MKRSNDLAIEHRVRGIVKKLTRDWGEPALKRALYRAQVIVYWKGAMTKSGKSQILQLVPPIFTT